MKVCFGISFCLILFIILFLLVILVTILILCSILPAEAITAISAMLSFLVAFIATCYAIKQYESHKKDEHIKLLCDYNQRYSTDGNIKKVIKWMLKVAVTDEDGDIIGVNLHITPYSPGINTKEMFMRFFEELNFQIEKKSLDSKEVFDLFAYYALKFHEYKDFRLDIDDYKTNEEISDITDDKAQKKMEYRWHNFRSFIEKMIIEEKMAQSEKRQNKD